MICMGTLARLTDPVLASAKQSGGNRSNIDNNTDLLILSPNENKPKRQYLGRAWTADAARRLLIRWSLRPLGPLISLCNVVHNGIACAAQRSVTS